jgi:hypothetical protein
MCHARKVIECEALCGRIILLQIHWKVDVGQADFLARRSHVRVAGPLGEVFIGPHFSARVCVLGFDGVDAFAQNEECDDGLDILHQSAAMYRLGMKTIPMAYVMGVEIWVIEKE